jgi:hypothetical protein
MDEKRIENLETIAKRLMRRAGKTTHALVTPYPISNAVFGEKISGPILRYMFPCEGTLIKGVVRLGIKPKNPIVLGVKLFNNLNSNAKGFVIDRRILTINPDIPVNSGDCLEVSLEVGEETVTEIWISLLWKPTVKDVEVKSFLNEELENDLQEGTKSLTE